MSEIARRWAVAVVGVPVVVWVLFVGSWALAITAGVFAVIGCAETFRLAEVREIRPVRWIGIPLAGSLVAAAALLPASGDFASVAIWLIAGGTVLALVTATFRPATRGAPLVTTAVTLFGSLYPALALATLPLMHAMPAHHGWAGLDPSPWANVAVVSLPLGVTWIGDAAAFFAGSALGRRRLAPSISPKKSWEGAAAGVTASGVAAVAWWTLSAAALPEAPVRGVFSLFGIGVLLGAAGIVGDLVESALKREAGVKDSGSVLPGHGGVLDRLDGLVVTLPLAYALLVVLEVLR